MKPLDIRYKYLILFFIVVFISINSVNATDSVYTNNNGDLSYSDISISENSSNHQDLDFKSCNLDSDDLDSSYKCISSCNLDSDDLDSSYKCISSCNLDSDDLNSSYKCISLDSDDLDYSNSLGNNLYDKNIVSIGASSTRTVISSSDLNMYYGTGSSVVGCLKTSGGKTIKGKVVRITINSKTYTKTTDNYGRVSLKISLNPGVYSTKFSFAGGSSYTASSCIVKVNVKKLSTKIITNDLAICDNSVGNIVATLKDNLNKPMINKNIKFSLNGVDYTNISNSNGIVYFTVPSLDKNVYNATLNFDGDKYYSSSSVSLKIKVFSEKEFDMDDIEDKSINIVNYIEKNHNLPKDIIISNENLSLIEFLGLISLDILNINKNSSSPVILDDFSYINSDIFKSCSENVFNGKYENIKEGSLSKREYIKIANTVALNYKSAINLDSSLLGNVNSSFSRISSSLLGYVNSSLGKISCNSLIYIFSNIIKSYSTFGVMPESVNIYPWALISNDKTVFINCNDILDKSLYLTEYIESNHSLPSNIVINSSKSLINLNLAQFLKLELDTLVEIPLNSIQSIVLKDYKVATSSYEKISTCSLDINSYYDIGLKIINFFNKNNRAPNYVATNKGSLGFESMIYTYSQILVSISKFSSLPSYINVVPWSVVKNRNTLFVSMDNIFSMANTVENEVLSNRNLDSNFNLNNNLKSKINLAQFLYLEVFSIDNINNDLYQSIILKSFSNPTKLSESLKEGKLNKTNYLKLMANIKSFLVNNNRLPNYASSSLGNINYKNSIFIFSEILTYFNNYNKLPSSILINPWSVISNKNVKLFSQNQIINLSYYIRDYVENNHCIPNNIPVNILNKDTGIDKVDSASKSYNINKFQLLKLELSTLYLINDTNVGNLFLDNYNYKYATDSLSAGFFSQKEYLDIAKSIEYNMNFKSFSKESTSLGNIAIDNALYIYSQILVSYNNTGILPDFVNIKPWSLISNKNTKFVSIENINNISKSIKNYIEANNSLPSHVKIDGNDVDMPNLAYILAISLKMVNGSFYGNIPLDKFYLPNNYIENITPHSLNENSYLAIAYDFVAIIDKNKAIPSYLNTEFGKIRYESLILLYATVLDYMENGEFLNNTVILPWNLINSSKFFTIDDIVNASYNLKEYIELNHKLPNDIIVNGYKLSILDYCNIASEAILNIDGDMYSSLIARNFSSKDYEEAIKFFNHSCDSNGNYSCNLISGGNKFDDIDKIQVSNMYISEYIYLINQVNQYFNSNLKYFDTSIFENDFNKSSIELNAMVFLMSNVLSSYMYYDKLPDYLNFISWNDISNEFLNVSDELIISNKSLNVNYNSIVFLKPESIVNSSFYLKNYIDLNHKLPDNVVIGNISLNMVQLLDVYTSCIYDINFNIYQSIILRDFSYCGVFSSNNGYYVSFENIISGDLDYFEYISLVCDLKELFDDGIIVSNLSNISLGDNIGFNSLLLMETLILNHYLGFNSQSGGINSDSISSIVSKVNESELVSSVTIIPWIVISNPGKVYNYRTCKVFDSIQKAIDDNETLSGDYIGVSKSEIYETIKIDKSIYLAPVSGYNVSFISNDLNNAFIYLYANSSEIEGFNFIGCNNSIDIIGSFNTISNCVFNCKNGVIIRGDDNSIEFNEFNCSSAIVYGDFNTFESNTYSGGGIRLINSLNSSILGNIIHSEDYALYIYNSSSDINFNSIISDIGIYIDSNLAIDLNNNWWGVNNPLKLNYLNNYISNDSNNEFNGSKCSIDFNGSKCSSSNVILDSWLVLSLDSFVDYSSPSIGTYNVVLIGNLRSNNFDDIGYLDDEYAIDNLNMNFRINDESHNIFSIDGECSYIINASLACDVFVSLTLDNEEINKTVYLPSNTSYGVINNRSGRSYKSIQEAIDSNDTVNGDTILLNRGIYFENLFIYKNITLKANGTVYLNSLNSSKSTITIFANSPIISDLFISGDDESYAISNYGVNTRLINCSLSGSMVGFYSMGSYNCSLINCSFIDNEYGAYISYGDDISFSNCSFIDDSYGIFGLSDNNITIDDCNFNSCWISLDLVNSISFIKNNEFKCSYLGLELINNTDSIIKDNVFYNNVVGYSLYNSTVESSSNRFVNNTLGDFTSFDECIELQNDMWSCGPASLVTVLHKLGYMAFNQVDISNATSVCNKGASLYGLLEYLHSNDIKNFTDAACFKVNTSDLSPLDIVLLDINGNFHYSVVWAISDGWNGTSGILDVNCTRIDYNGTIRNNLDSEWIVLADSTSGMLNLTRSSFEELFTSNVLALNSNHPGIILNSQEIYDIYGDLSVESAWTWLNTPICHIPYYNQLDNYGVIGQSVKLAGWFLLGIDDNGGITPLNIGLDALSIVSGFGVAERLGLDGASLAVKLLEKPLVHKFVSKELSNSANVIFKNYKTVLSILSNPIRFGINKISTNTLKAYEGKSLADFALGYLNNNYCSFATVLGISGSYDNAKENLLLGVNTIKKSSSQSLKDIIYSSTSTIASSLKNTDIALKSIYKSYDTISKKVTKAASTIKKSIDSTSKYLKSKSKYIINTVKKNSAKTISKVKKYVSKTSYRIKKYATNTAYKLKKAISSGSKSIKKYATNTVYKVKSTVNKVKRIAKSLTNLVKLFKF